MQMYNANVDFEVDRMSRVCQSRPLYMDDAVVIGLFVLCESLCLHKTVRLHNCVHASRI